jgi:hypothetical protein
VQQVQTAESVTGQKQTGDAQLVWMKMMMQSMEA